LNVKLKILVNIKLKILT